MPNPEEINLPPIDDAAVEEIEQIRKESQPKHANELPTPDQKKLERNVNKILKKFNNTCQKYSQDEAFIAALTFLETMVKNCDRSELPRFTQNLNLLGQKLGYIIDAKQQHYKSEDLRKKILNPNGSPEKPNG